MVKHIVSFSGGKDSSCLLLKMLEKNMQIDDIVFCDTTKEFPDMLKHIDQVEKYINRKITRVSFDFDYWFKDHIKTKGKRKGEKGYGWMMIKQRWCSRLKIRAIQSYLKKYDNCVQYVGIAYEERHRTKNSRMNKNKKYPLIDWKITSKDALKYCYEKGFYWNGLYKKFHRVSCFLCPFSRVDYFRKLYKHFPELWEEIRKLDKFSVKKFRTDYTLDQLERRFENENKQKLLYK